MSMSKIRYREKRTTPAALMKAEGAEEIDREVLAEADTCGGEVDGLVVVRVLHGDHPHTLLWLYAVGLAHEEGSVEEAG